MPCQKPGMIVLILTWEIFSPRYLGEKRGVILTIAKFQENINCARMDNLAK